MDISFPALQSINNGVQMSFNDQLYAAESIYKPFTYESNSVGDAEVYPRLDMIPGIREWVGERVVHSLTQSTFTIANKTFENTISIRREQIEDDKFGLLTPIAQQMGQDAGLYPDLLIAKLLLNGHTTVGVDGQNFFDTAHSNFTNAGGVTTIANYQAGSGNPSWYLVDTSRVLKPFIFQNRRPFKLVPKFSMTDPSVFYDNEFTWGVDGRCNAGYGLWQLAFRSDAVLNQANVTAGRTTMAGWRRPDGTPMGIGSRGLLLVVPSSLYPTARAYCENDYDPLLTSNLTPNNFKGLAKALENPWLS